MRGSTTTPEGLGRRTVRLALASTFIVAVLGLQALAMLDRRIGPIERAPFLWPFVNYPMYSHARDEGDEILRPVVVGVRADGDRVVMEPEDLGLLYFFYRQGPVRAIQRGDRERARLYTERYEQLHGIELAGFELRHRPVVVERDGYRVAPERSVAAISLVEGPR